MKKLKEGHSDSAMHVFVKEAERLARLQHPNIVCAIGCQFATVPHMIILEYLPVGDLKSYMQGTVGQLTLEHQIYLALDVSAGFDYLQQNKFVHRDLAARNVLIDASHCAKISDFGMARQLFTTEYYRQGSTSTSWTLPLRWMAPESYTDGSWDLRSDVWMFGVLLWEIFSLGEQPWKDLPNSHVIQNIQRRAKLDQPTNCPNEFYYDIMLSCWRIDPFARIDGAAILRTARQYTSENMARDGRLSLSWPVPTTPALVPDTLLLDLGFDIHSSQSDKIMSELEVSLSSIEIGDILGQGAFGSVSRGKVLKEGRIADVAIKSMRGGSTSEAQRKFADEARLFAMLHHNNIVKCVGVHLTSEPLLILLELMQCDLKSFLKRPDPVSSSLLIGVVSQIARAMDYLSSIRIVHRDLAARNVLVSSQGLVSVKLNDFGLSRTLSTSDYYKKVSSDKIPIKWMAPESILERKYTSASDVWSFGIFCWEVFELGKTPYPGLGIDAVLGYVLRGNRMDKPALCPDAIYDLMLQCWQLEKSSRPTFTFIVSSLSNVLQSTENDEESRL